MANYTPIENGHDVDLNRVLLSSFHAELLSFFLLLGLPTLALMEIAQLLFQADLLCEELGTLALQCFDELIIFFVSWDVVDWLDGSIGLLRGLLISRRGRKAFDLLLGGSNC